MSWVTVIWSMTASACLTLALMNFFIWFRQRDAWASLLFAFTAVGTAAVAGFELAMMRAETTAAFGLELRWIHVPAWVVILSLAGFVRLYLNAGRAWLLWSLCGLRTFSLILNFLLWQNLNFWEITRLRHVPFLGESVSVAEGVLNPWMLAGQATYVLLLMFVADATLTAWRRGDRQRALLIGGSVFFFVLAASGETTLVLWQVIHWPVIASLPAMIMVAAMSFELSRHAQRASLLARELSESEERMTLAVEAAGIGVWMWSIARNQVWGSERWLRLFGFNADAGVSFENVVGRIHPDDRQMVEQEVRRALADRSHYLADHRVILPDGAQRWIVARGRVYSDARGKPARMLGVAIDITERKQSEAALRESEARFRSMADTAPVLIWMSGTDKLCNFFNQGWLDFTGRTLEQELGNGWAEGVHPEDLAGCLKSYGGSFDARRPFTLEYRLRRHDGAYRWISDTGVPRYDAQRNFLGYIGCCVDLTENRRAAEQFRLVVESSPSGIVLVNGEGRIVLVNATAEKLFGCARGELIGQAVEKLLPERFHRAHPGHRAGFHAAPQARDMGAGRELFARRKDGTEFPVEVGLSPVQSAEGALVLTVIVDITQRKQAERELQLQRDELAHLSRVTMLGQLASSLAHELNQPLGAILRNAEAAELFLKEPAPDLEELRAILADIRQDDQRAGAVINRMRSLVKRRETEQSEFDPNLLAADVINLVRADAGARKIRLAFEPVPALPPVRGDRVQLQQVLLNLLLNAMDAVNNSAPANRRVMVRIQPADTRVEVAVSDTGHGIPADKLASVFEPFFTTKPNGMGMGLPISRSIVEVHGGHLSAENNPDGGATFRFTLPAADAGARPGEQT